MLKSANIPKLVIVKNIVSILNIFHTDSTGEVNPYFRLENITDLELIRDKFNNHLIITTKRPGLIIGQGGTNIKSLELKLNKFILQYLSEEFDVTDFKPIKISLKETPDVLKSFVEKYR